MSLVRPASGRPRASSACIGPLASCSALGRAGSASHARQRRLAPAASSVDQVDVRRGAVGRGDGDRPRRRRCRAPSVPTTCTPGPRAGRRARPATPATSLGAEHARRRRRSRARPPARRRSRVANSRSRSTRNSRPSKTWWTCSRSQDRRCRSATLDRAASRSPTSWLSRRLRSTAVEVLAQALAGLAGDLVDVRDDAVEVAVLVDPLGGGLRARRPARRAGCRWTRRPARRGRCTARAATPYLACTAAGRHPGQLGDARGPGRAR